MANGEVFSRDTRLGERLGVRAAATLRDDLNLRRGGRDLPGDRRSALRVREAINNLFNLTHLVGMAGNGA